MKVVQSGDVYNLYDDSVRTFDRLPPKTFSVEYDPRNGCYLMEHSDLEVLEKAYGVQDQKVEKVMNTFEHVPRNLGVILSGDKGIGKTMFAKKLCMKAIEQGIPVVLVEEYYPQLVRLIEKIDQECLVLFDEFDKTFCERNDDYDDEEENDDQTKLLSLFDGTSGGKKLFVLTCNELLRLDDCLVNRPGRFHYHFMFEYPTASEIEEYMKDHLAEQHRGEISKIVSFARRVRLNYDCLRAIAFEINHGSCFEEAICDLNILNVDEVEYNVTLHFENGKKLYNRRYRVDLYDEEETFGWMTLSNEAGADVVDIRFNKALLGYDSVNGSIFIPAKGLSLDFDDYDEDRKDVSYFRRLKPDRLIFSRCKPRNWNYSV